MKYENSPIKANIENVTAVRNKRGNTVYIEGFTLNERILKNMYQDGFCRITLSEPSVAYLVTEFCNDGTVLALKEVV